MRLRQEQVVLVLTVLVLGLMGWGLFGSEVARRTSRGAGSSIDFEHHRTPDVAVALPNDAAPPLARELFAPPRDTRPLPPLDLVEPPRRPLPGLFPPADPGPAPSAFGRLLRRETVVVEVADLFEEDDEFFGSDADEAFEELAGEDESTRDLLRQTSDQDEDPYAEETPAEREARYAGYRSRYDWVQRGAGDTIFGRIENEDRYGLEVDSGRANEPLLFVRLNPDTGREWLANIVAPPMQIDRGAIVDFDFAATVANQLEVRRREIGDQLTRGSYEEALELAAFAVRRRLEAPQALTVAEGIYRLCAAYDDEDPEPRLGLGRCFEAGFRFEDAFEEYNALLGRFAHRAEVHVRLAQLEERFLLYDRAEARLREALAVDRSSWEARFGLGSFLAKRGRHADAIEHLRQANRSAPADPELVYLRAQIRVALADALYASGNVSEAQHVYEQALSADAGNQRASAGRITTELLLVAQSGTGTNGINGAGGSGASLQDDQTGDGYELLLARGLVALSAGDFTGARDHFQLAVDADPLRAQRPLGALSYLAQATGNEAEALSFAEEALVHDPTDAYALYQKGRLLGGQDDYEGARDALLAALESELDFEDALVALGDMAFRLGRFEDAERYLERAISIDGSRPEVHALRGVNYLRLSLVPDARASFDRALEIDPVNAIARSGNAWCTYLDGDVTKALVYLRDVDDSRRELPEDDPWRTWARSEIERIQDHVEKVEWRDNFNRKRLINGWLTREGAGPIVSMEDGAAKIEGVFERPLGITQVYREYTASEFVSFAADVWISAESNVRTGIFIARERQKRRNERDVIAEASVSRHKDGDLQIRTIRQGQPEAMTDMEQDLPTGRWVRLAIERSGQSSQTTVTLSMDGIPLIEGQPLPSAGSASSPLLLGLFVEGDIGEQVRVLMDNAAVVYRGNR